MSFIILDRDGVINYDSVEYIKSPDEWRPIPGSLEAIAHLNRAGFRVLIATNQSGVARGYYDIATLDSIHEKLTAELAAVGGCIEEIFFCPHHPDEQCGCRKPAPGLIYEMQKKYALPLEETYFIGDSAVDMLVAQKTGCRPILVLTGNGRKVLEQHPELIPPQAFDNLAAAVDFVVSEKRNQHG